MDLELKSDLDREVFLRDLADPILHFADEPLANPRPQKSEPTFASHSEATPQTVESPSEPVFDNPPPIAKPTLPHRAQPAVQPAVPTAPANQKATSQPSPKIPERIKAPAPITPPEPKPNAVQRTKRWSRSMFSAITSRNNKT